jgi:hypothetical protein
MLSPNMFQPQIYNCEVAGEKETGPQPGSLSGDSRMKQADCSTNALDL